MGGKMLNILICQIFIGATFLQSSKAVDSQMLSFLLSEMSTYRTMTLDMQNEIKALKSTVSNLTSQNDHLQRMVTSLDSQTKHLEQELVNNVSKLNTDIVTVDRATNTSVLFIQLEEKIFEQRIEEELRNISTEFNAKLNNSTLNVIFSAHGAPGNLMQLTGVTFTKTSINTPPSYNHASGRYTVPKHGFYILHMTDSITTGINNKSPFMVNDKRQPGCFSANGTVPVCQIYVQLQAGDQIWVQDFTDFIHTNISKFSIWKI
ncbi:uncharacterized protein LOC125649125 [Ostrea edulis]|uniref:uncharacterized protein LOC125649125 n=1 Tax=Ostrea edulis TaxID=37623 RepID=UPI002094CE92|nr:uncharacterized protein LOC125649125 [Ostrea edulis]